MSPLHRAVEANKAAFEEKLQTWRDDPRKLGEFLKKLSIVKIEYHGLWADVEYKVRGSIVAPDGRQHGFRREATKRFVRLGKRWYVYDEATDAAFFSDSDDEADDG